MKRPNRVTGYRPIPLDPLFLHGFTKYPNAVRDSPELTVGSKFLYLLLCGYAFDKKQCFPSQRLLALQCQVTVRTIRRWMLPLTDLGLVQIMRPDPCHTNHYRLADGTPEPLTALGDSSEARKRDSRRLTEAEWSPWSDPFGEDSG
jgi:hypothetical protein